MACQRAGPREVPSFVKRRLSVPFYDDRIEVL